MAITGPASYLPTIDEFTTHWRLADQQINGQVRLRDDFKVNNLESLRADLAAARTDLTAKLNDREFASADIQRLKETLLERLNQFNDRVRVLFDEGSRYVNALPKVPSPSSAVSRIAQQMDDAADIWKRIEAEGTSIALVGNYTQQNFADDLAAFRAADLARTGAVTAEKIARGVRNELQDKIRPRLKQYREVIPTYFVEDSAIVEKLPRLTPLPGSTPDPVNASAVWDAAESKARLSWNESENKNLKEYQVRYTPGDSYEENDESVVTNIQPDEPRELLTDAGLTQVGAASSFKVFVILKTGNEAGSTALTVERPES